jgi:predicted Rossmann-fold nucleotide-binding protein
LPVSTAGSRGGVGQEDRRRGSHNRRRVGEAVGQRGVVVVDGGGAGTMVADDGALARHHGEGEREVRWGRD